MFMKSHESILWLMRRRNLEISHYGEGGGGGGGRVEENS